MKNRFGDCNFLLLGGQSRLIIYLRISLSLMEGLVFQIASVFMINKSGILTTRLFLLKYSPIIRLFATLPEVISTFVLLLQVALILVRLDLYIFSCQIIQCRKR